MRVRWRGGGGTQMGKGVIPETCKDQCERGTEGDSHSGS